MMTTYPGFQGVDLTTIDKAKTQQWYDADNIVIIRRVAGMSVGLVKLNKQRQLDQIAKEIGPLDKNPQTRPGFRTYFVKYRGSAENSLVISCPKPGGQLTNTDFCQVEAAVAPDFVVTYQFRPPLLPHWQEIDDGVMNVLNSFVEK
jgi:hypothetical protein